VELDRLAVVLRQRNPWEAMDLGFAMTREWWRPAYCAWLIVLVPPALAAVALLPPAWAILTVWWLKPAFERIPLHVLAGAVFGSPPPLRETLLGFASYARNGLLISLLPPVRLFLWSRSFDLPIRQLEGARGRERRNRTKQLHRRAQTYAVRLTAACLGFELVVLASLIGLYDLLLPATIQESFDIFALLRAWASSRLGQLVAALYVVCVALIGPLYVAAGFALYLARRTQLEGWDLEVQLRRIAQHAHARQTSSPVATRAAITTLLALVVVSGAALAPVPGFAQERSEIAAREDAPHSPAGPPAEPGAEAAASPAAPVVYRHGRASAEIKTVLALPTFERYETRLVIKPLHKPEPEERRNLDSLHSLIRSVAEVMRVAAWGLLAAFVAFAAYWVLRRLDWLRPESTAAWTPPATLFGLDVRPASLPEDVAGAATALAAQGDLVGALSLLYRGSLVALMHRDRIELASGDTESDCLTKTHRQMAEPAHAYLVRLLLAWQRAAYAHRAVPPAEVQQLVAEWPAFFRMGTAA